MQYVGYNVRTYVSMYKLLTKVQFLLSAAVKKLFRASSNAINKTGSNYGSDMCHVTWPDLTRPS